MYPGRIGRLAERHVSVRNDTFSVLMQAFREQSHDDALDRRLSAIFVDSGFGGETGMSLEKIDAASFWSAYYAEREHLGALGGSSEGTEER